MAKRNTKPEYQFIIILEGGGVEFIPNETELKQALAEYENIDIESIHEIKRDVKYTRTKQQDIITLQ